MVADRTHLVGGRAVPSRRCTNDWNNVPLKRHAPIASVAALRERHAHPRITERPRRPHAPCRGAACRSRRCTNDWNNVPLKRHAPIASVAALRERHAHPRITERPRRPHAPCRGRAFPSRRCTGVISGPSIKRGWPPDLSLRGGRRPTWRPEREARGSALGVQSRGGSCDFADGFPVIRPGTARLPRRFAPRNDTSGRRSNGNGAAHRIGGTTAASRTGGACPAPTGPVRIERRSVQIGSAFPRLPRPLWGLAMTRQGSAVVRR